MCYTLTMSERSPIHMSKSEANISEDSFSGFLVRDMDASFAVEIKDESLSHLGIFYGDYVVVERGILPRYGDIVFAVDLFNQPSFSVYQKETLHNFLKVDGVVVSLMRRYKK